MVEMDIYVDRWRLYWTFVSPAGSWLLLLCPMFMRSRAPTGLLVFVGRILNSVMIVIVFVCNIVTKPLFPLTTHQSSYLIGFDHHQDYFAPTLIPLLMIIKMTLILAERWYWPVSLPLLLTSIYNIYLYISIFYNQIYLLLCSHNFQLIKSTLLNGCLFFRRLIPMETRIAKRAEESGQKSHL